MFGDTWYTDNVITDGPVGLSAMKHMFLFSRHIVLANEGFGKRRESDASSARRARGKLSFLMVRNRWSGSPPTMHENLV